MGLAAKNNLSHGTTAPPSVMLETLDWKIYNFDYVKNFTKDAVGPHIHAFELLKPLPQFYIDFLLKGRRGSSFGYNISNMDGCIILKSIANIKLFSQIYEQILVERSSPFECPLKPKVYYLRDVISYGSAAYFGRSSYKLTVQIRLEESSLPICTFEWKYIVRS
ncbi:uncharacterized protein LOC110118930 [Ceratitis capitata]|uniref:uncharacterized protein LOC110118930 n=1 Tax=Ceratitis capitata TaxID=7213 RepID=UPI000A110F99|nr:uncharacterized protein LOC110118930 [Ceratitis capitata]